MGGGRHERLLPCLVWFGFPGLPRKRANDFFVLPDCCHPAKRLAHAASAGEDGGCVD